MYMTGDLDAATDAARAAAAAGFAMGLAVGMLEGRFTPYIGMAAFSFGLAQSKQALLAGNYELAALDFTFAIFSFFTGVYKPLTMPVRFQNASASAFPKKAYSNPSNRPKYAKDQVEQVWNNAKQSNDRVYDPNNGDELFSNLSEPRTRQRNMGHKPGKKYSDLHKDYMDDKITLDEFLLDYHNPDNYVPEAWLSNQSHAHE